MSTPAKKMPDEAEPADLSGDYGAPFPIHSRDEGARYVSLSSSRRFTSPRYLDFDLMPASHADAVHRHCRALGWDKFVRTRHDGYKQLMLEFYTTLDFVSDGGGDGGSELRCRLMGRSVSITRRSLCDLFGFHEGGHTAVPGDFDPAGFWAEITGGRVYRSSESSRFIKDRSLRIMQSYISQVVLGRIDSGKITERCLFYLQCMSRGVGVCTPSFLVGTFKSVIRNPQANLCLGNFITGIAVCLGVLDSKNMDLVPARALGLGMLKGVPDHGSCAEFKVLKEPKCYKTDGVRPVTDDILMSICRWLEKMEKWMKDGLAAVNAQLSIFGARLDAVENMVCAMDSRFRTFWSKWEDSGQENVNTDKTSDELRMGKFQNLRPRIRKVDEEHFNLEEEGNLGFPDAKGRNEGLRYADILSPGVRSVSNSTGNRSFRPSMEGDRKLAKPWMRENDSHFVKSSCASKLPHGLPEAERSDTVQDDHHGAPSGFGVRSMVRCSAKEKNACKVKPYSGLHSGRVDMRLSKSNEMNLDVGLSYGKRKASNCMEELIADLTKKSKRNTRSSNEDFFSIHEKEDDDFKSTYEPKSDSGALHEVFNVSDDDDSCDPDDSCTNSRMEEFVASFRR